MFPSAQHETECNDELKNLTMPRRHSDTLSSKAATQLIQNVYRVAQNRHETIFADKLPSIADLLASRRAEELIQLTEIEYVSRPRSRTEPPFPIFQSSPVSTSETEPEDTSPWPSAAQYQSIFVNHSTSMIQVCVNEAVECENGQIPLYDLGLDARGVALHPEFIYVKPISCMYFLCCKRLLGKGSFGFPRRRSPSPRGYSESARCKEYEWRKMSFITTLPKQKPLVRYVTATCYTRTSSESQDKRKVFRMHAVMLASEDGTLDIGDFVLVHIRAGGNKRIGIRAPRVCSGD
uniref:Uncharacterized protein AlNc14C137G7124 n=1 Tax=Albugo laibachii Nc14 TaxID=890382 RepID=F0WKT5_9STRA|nr:conserved hypothetical protein [Albugo laibachii Nc14]|eukprot:CCA21892.1 conserved hypothetical protein [Albugo laibachii Nc14]